MVLLKEDLCMCDNAAFLAVELVLDGSCKFLFVLISQLSLAHYLHLVFNNAPVTEIHTKILLVSYLIEFVFDLVEGS